MRLVAFRHRLPDTHAHVHELRLHGIREGLRERGHMFAVVRVVVCRGVRWVDAGEEGGYGRLAC